MGGHYTRLLETAHHHVSVLGGGSSVETYSLQHFPTSFQKALNPSCK